MMSVLVSFLAVPGVLPTGVATDPCDEWLSDPVETADAGHCANGFGPGGRSLVAGGNPPAVGTNVYAEPREGDSVTMWTPVMVVNSPRHGKADASATAQIETTFDFGIPVQFSYAEIDKHTVAIDAEDGRSFGYYVLATWTYKCQLNSAGYNVYCKYYWDVTNYEPLGHVESKTVELTGGSQETDADNVVVPPELTQTGFRVMAVTTQYKNQDVHECGAIGSSISHDTGSSRQYKVSATFAYQDATIVGSSTSVTIAGSYHYEFPGGLCFSIDHLGDGNGYAFQYEGVVPGSMISGGLLLGMRPVPPGPDLATGEGEEPPYPPHPHAPLGRWSVPQL